MPSPTKTKSRNDESRSPGMRARLAQCAFELLSREGFQNVNLDMVARHAGVTKGSLYWHYSSKKELILAACAHYYRRWQQDAHSEIARDNQPRAQLERVIRMSVRKCLFDPDNRLFTSEIFAMSLQDREIRASWSQFYDTVRELYIGLAGAIRNESLTRISGSKSKKTESASDDIRNSIDWMLSTLEGIKQRAAFEPDICDQNQLETITSRLVCMAIGKE